MDKKHFWKFAGGFIAIIAAGLVILYASNYFFSEEVRETRKAKQYLEDLKKQYENDTYGGKTPEETLELFISALEKGDIDLASKYFVLDKQEEMRGGLKLAIENGTNKELLDILSLRTHRQGGAQLSENRYLIDFINQKNNVADFGVTFQKYPQGIWKIEDL